VRAPVTLSIINPKPIASWIKLIYLYKLGGLAIVKLNKVWWREGQRTHHVSQKLSVWIGIWKKIH
jgi:hypothetical protein